MAPGAESDLSHPDDGSELLNRLPGLVEPLLQIDLERELQQLGRAEGKDSASVC